MLASVKLVSPLYRVLSQKGVQFRQFQTCYNLLKKASKKSGKGKIDEEEPTEVVDVKQYVLKAKTQFSVTLDLHKKKLSEIRAGSASPSIFDKLSVGKENSKFTDVATTSMKGKNSLIVTVFDPKDTKSVVSSILAAGLNLNPEKIPNNDQQLKISLPPPTTETRKQTCKQLKEVFEEFKNSANKNSLGHIRGDILKQLKNIDKKNDSVKKVIQDLDKLHKEYTNTLQEQLKQAEKNVLG
ncbi:Rrf1p [Lachancea thermotolerans CBS 6340]|uniref:Ribosome-recycling factor, mitochondrial n=1 Tax=Lachancea thermotolerans (strain ATCC 56472 / CBS 6340 / NRRL Y-8284) TaxID=559295 RepID=C5DM62_LACTC|nr:KLTH0G06270p [Lachancea thermotolerans CBS 6340]CAR24873.1 KLTH0G06270p [Lachancea thermotolerans CBS 6340]